MDWLNFFAVQGINFMVAIIICSDFGAQKSKKSATVSSSICHEVIGLDHYHSLALAFTRVLSFLKWDLIYNHHSGENGEGNGKPLQDFCLENLMDGGAW